jgi:hypothetical protein
MLRELLDAIVGLDALREAFSAAHYGWNPDIALRSLAAIWLCACTLAISLRAAHWLLPGVGVPLRWSSVFGIGMWLATVGFHLLRSLGLFKLQYALIACSGLLAITLFAAPGRVPLAAALRHERRALRRVFQLFRRGRYNLWTGCFISFAALLALRSLIIPPLGWDTLTYHGPRAALWLQTGQFTYDPGPGPYSVYRHLFSGGEVFAAWAMLPFRSDLLVNLATTAQWIGLGLASWALARALGLREPYAAASASVVMFAPTVQLEVGSGYVDVVLNTALLHGIALAVHCLRRLSAPACVVAAMSIGVAAGIKLTGAPPGVIVASMLVLRLLSARGLAWMHKLGYLLLSCLCALIPVAPWTMAAWRETGYPLSPFPVQIWGFKLGLADPALQWYQERPELTAFDWAAEKAALLKLFSSVDHFNESLGSLAVIPILVFPLGLLIFGRRRPITALTLAAAAAAPVFAHFSAAMNAPRLLWAPSTARYLITTLAIIVPLSFAVCRTNVWVGRSYRLLALMYPLTYSVLAARRGWAKWEIREVIIVTAGVLLAVCWVQTCKSPRSRLALGLLLCMVGCSALQVRRDETRQRAFAESFALHSSPREWSDAVPWIDAPGPHRIALTGGARQASDRWFQYFLFGPRLRNRVYYVPPTRDGGIAHFGPHGDLDDRADEPSWRARLRAARITEIATFAPRSMEQRWMDAAPEHYEKLVGTEHWGLYRLKL